ncbi:Predicted PurR-regulated permease PerM [Noviherbaspirillum humi]|uniref:Predicted PurR-regulated permease PerM n=1 Tax=Noviherbaspirillum humi TaxID=1688639 RepID=A0A239KXB8_9BURK|nr:AI-2E family transporter [Noviherbaspirillum humi]SNT23017.1 Predicted PurR-regulated permease PerM [Noviherbaspirillum humi]
MRSETALSDNSPRPPLPAEPENLDGIGDDRDVARPAQGGGVMTAALLLLTIAALYFGREIFVPFALAVLLSFMLAPLVAWLRRLHVPRVPSVILVVVAAFAFIGGLSVLVGSQVIHIAENLPTYEQTMRDKIRSLRHAAPGGGVLDRATEVFQSLGRELSTPNEVKGTGAAPAKAKPQKEPIPVRIEPPDNQALGNLEKAIAPLLGPVGTAGIVVVFIIFVLLERNDLSDRFIRLMGGDLHRTTEALNEAARRVSRYLLMQLVVNATYGIPVGLGLYMIGVPGAFLWGLMATLLRFVPYLGPFIAAFFPMVLAFGVDPGWSMLLWTVALLVAMELISNNFIEPWLYGSSTGLSPVAVILAAIFWTTLWGPIGLILATPLTVCLVVMGRYVPQLQFLEVLLGSDPVLAPEERFYQRLLARNIEEAVEIAELQVAETALLPFYDQVCLPALKLAENDRQRGASPEDRRRVADGVRAVVRELGAHRDRRDEAAAAPAGSSGPVPRWYGMPVLCIGGRSELDAASAAMTVDALESCGIGARQLPATAVSLEAIGSLELAGVSVVCLCYLTPEPHTYARFVTRRLKRRMAQLKVIIGAWNLGTDQGSAEQFATQVGADAAVTSLDELREVIESLLDDTDTATAQEMPVSPQESDRLEALRASGLLETPAGDHLDRVAKRLADAFDAPIGLVSLIDARSQLWKGASGLPPDLNQSRQTSRDTSVCTYVVASGLPLVVEDLARDRRFTNNPLLREHGIRFYAGVPLKTSSGHAIGSLCVMDTRPRSLSARDTKLLQLIADELMAEFDHPAAAAVHAEGGAKPALPERRDEPQTEAVPGNGG